MSTLADRHCERCTPGTPSLQEDVLADLLSELSNSWARDDQWLVRKLNLKDFREAFSHATRVALLAEQEGHHPDLEVGWGYLNIRLTTHAAGGLTENDFIMAAKIDGLLA